MRPLAGAAFEACASDANERTRVSMTCDQRERVARGPRQRPEPAGLTIYGPRYQRLSADDSLSNIHRANRHH